MTAPKLTNSQFKIAVVATKCVESLVKSGKTVFEAENAVIEVLKEMDTANSKPSVVCGMLEMIFLDKDVSVVAKNVIKNL